MKETIRKGFCAVLSAMLVGFAGLILFASANGPSLAMQLMEAPVGALLHIPNMVLCVIILLCMVAAGALVWIGFIQELK